MTTIQVSLVTEFNILNTVQISVITTWNIGPKTNTHIRQLAQERIDFIY